MSKKVKIGLGCVLHRPRATGCSSTGMARFLVEALFRSGANRNAQLSYHPLGAECPTYSIAAMDERSEP